MKKFTSGKTKEMPYLIRGWCAKLLLVFLVVQGTAGLAQTGTIGIGSGTDTDGYYMPLLTVYDYNYSQQIVMASEYTSAGGAAGPITKIRYYLAYGDTPLNAWEDWTIYLGHTNKSSFTTDTDWVPLASLTQVFAGTVTQVDESWMEITLTTPFVYDGVSNIVVAVNETTPGYAADWGESYFGTYISGENTGIYYYADGVGPDPASPPAAEGRTDIVPRLQFVGTMASCLPPTALAASGSFTSGEVNFTASASTPANGYQYYHNTTNTPPTATTTATGTAAAGQTSFSIPGLTTDTTYYVWVRSVCSASDSSTWTGPVEFYTGYCTPAPSSVDGIGITNVTIGTINNSTEEEIDNYGDFTAMSATYALGATVNFSITYETEYTYGTKIWVDWNNDADFTDAGELVYTGLSESDDPTTLTGSFQVPANAAYIGNRRLRIGGTDNDEGPSEPCYTGTYGTFEDYTLNLVMPPAPVVTTFTPDVYCAATGDITITGTNLTAATLTIGGTAVSITTNTSTQIVATVPAGVSGVVAVTTVAGTSTTTETFTVTEPTALVLSNGDATICEGDTVPVTITAGASAYEQFIWAPATGITGDAVTGWVLSPGETTAYTLTATNTTTGCVVVKTITLTVNALPTGIAITPDVQEVCAGTTQMLTVAGATVTGGAVLGTGTTAPTSTDYPNPFSAYYGGVKTQMLYKAEELEAQGLIAGSAINSMAFDFFASVANANNDLKIRIGTTTTEDMADGFVDSSALTTVYSANFTPTAGTTGLVAFNFTTPYIWNGEDIIVEVVHNQGNNGNGSGTRTRTTDTAYESVYFAAVDGVTPAGVASIDVLDEEDFDYYGSSDLRPNAVFNYSLQNEVVWSPMTGLYVDEDATIAYTGEDVATVYVSPGANTTYTATVTNIAGCFVTASADVIVLNTPAPDADAEQTVCNEGTVADLTADSGNVLWYAGATGGTALADDTPLVNNTIYHVSQIVDGCESTLRTPVTVFVPVVAQPDGEAIQVVEETVTGTATIADIEVTGDNLVWYATEEDALAGEEPLDETDLLVSGTTYYVTQTIGSCTSAPLAITVTVSLGNNVFDASQFTYYPNPVKDVLTIKYSSDIASVTVCNLLGQQVLAKQINATTGTIDMSVLQDGTYILSVTSGDSVKTVKVIKRQ